MPPPSPVAQDIATYWRGLRDFGKKILPTADLRDVIADAAVKMQTFMDRQWIADLVPIIDASPPIPGKSKKAVIERQMELLDQVLTYPTPSAVTQRAGEVYRIYLMRGYRQS